MNKEIMLGDRVQKDSKYCYNIHASMRGVITTRLLMPDNTYEYAVQWDDMSVDVFTEHQLRGYLLLEEPNAESSPSCTHDWATYAGLIETYKYCTKCDKKDAT